MSTSISLLDPTAPPIDSGSTSLRRILGEGNLQRSVLLNIHGHTHDASGIARIGKITVLNPGALQDGRYASIVLENVGGRWNLVKIEMNKFL
jgi:Icc-related predicted phosphoesterase